MTSRRRFLAGMAATEAAHLQWSLAQARIARLGILSFGATRERSQ